MDIIIIDTETGGLVAEECGLCSVTLKVLNGEAIKTIYIKPEKDLRYEQSAFNVNKLSIEKLEKIGIAPEKAIQEIAAFISYHFNSKPYMLGHNTTFDLGFLTAFFKRNGNVDFKRMVNYHLMDTMYYAQVLHFSGIKPFDNFKLKTIHFTLFQKEIEDAHTSEGDVLATERVYNRLFKILQDMREVAMRNLGK
jgi:DNA polymerase III alpha subunit (gram-positive type)